MIFPYHLMSKERKILSTLLFIAIWQLLWDCYTCKPIELTSKTQLVKCYNLFWVIVDCLTCSTVLKSQFTWGISLLRRLNGETGPLKAGAHGGYAGPISGWRLQLDTQTGNSVFVFSGIGRIVLTCLGVAVGVAADHQVPFSIGLLVASCSGRQLIDTDLDTPGWSGWSFRRAGTDLDSRNWSFGLLGASNKVLQTCND